ncbi:transposase [Streptomyces sp. NPDC126514]|uniref:transposase n=1 Tax=Streptomyces sp. NPDC126514 TaxID=3155210 RepID=UPI0033302E93
MAGLIAEREWLAVFLLPTYSPDLNPVEWVWRRVQTQPGLRRRRRPRRVETLVRNRLKRLQYRPDTLDGFMAGTGLALNDPKSP